MCPLHIADNNTDNNTTSTTLRIAKIIRVSKTINYQNL
jgi:hypothetical protein